MRLKYGSEEIAFREEMGNVDYDSLGTIASKLYPNIVRRPSWDLWFMMYSGMNDIDFRCTDPEDYRTYTEDGPARIPVRYTMRARKPFVRTEDFPSSAPVEPTYMKKSFPVLSAMSNPLRIDILSLLMHSPMNNVSLCECTGLRENLLTYHIGALKDSGIVTSTKKGRNTMYSLADREAVESILNAAAAMSRNSERHKGSAALPNGSNTSTFNFIPGVFPESYRHLKGFNMDLIYNWI